MLIWLITVGEPLPTDGSEERLLRAGMLAKFLENVKALAETKKPSYNTDLLRQDMQFVLKKFCLTQVEFDKILNAPPKQATEYPNHYFLFRKLRHYKNIFRHIATSA